jgi:hypothetical protein
MAISASLTARKLSGGEMPKGRRKWLEIRRYIGSSWAKKK